MKKRFEYSNWDWSIVGFIDAENRERAAEKLKEKYNSFDLSWRIIRK